MGSGRIIEEDGFTFNFPGLGRSAFPFVIPILRRTQNL